MLIPGLWNFVFSLATPYMINSLGWGTFLFWGILNFVIAVCTALFLKETQGKSLEEINAEMSGNDDALRNKASRHSLDDDARAVVLEDGEGWDSPRGSRDARLEQQSQDAGV